jgi:hypothetical protein
VSSETFLVIYFNLCAVALAGWLTTRRRAARSDFWRVVSLTSAGGLVLLLALGGLGVFLFVLFLFTWRGC